MKSALPYSFSELLGVLEPETIARIADDLHRFRSTEIDLVRDATEREIVLHLQGQMTEFERRAYDAELDLYRAAQIERYGTPAPMHTWSYYQSA